MLILVCYVFLFGYRELCDTCSKFKFRRFSIQSMADLSSNVFECSKLELP